MHETLAEYFKAMQRGPDGVEELTALFADDAVYVEPFTPGGGIHSGRDAVGRWLTASQQHAPPELTLTIEKIDAEENAIQVEWTCTSPAFARPSRGRDRFTLRDGKIARLETTLTTAPELR